MKTISFGRKRVKARAIMARESARCRINRCLECEYKAYNVSKEWSAFLRQTPSSAPRKQSSGPCACKTYTAISPAFQSMRPFFKSTAFSEYRSFLFCDKDLWHYTRPEPHKGPRLTSKAYTKQTLSCEVLNWPLSFSSVSNANITILRRKQLSKNTMLGQPLIQTQLIPALTSRYTCTRLSDQLKKKKKK